MADESTQSIVIDATPEEIVAVIADFDAYPQWANGVKRTEVLETGADGRAAQVRFNIDQGPIKDEYVLAYDEWSTKKISWHLVKGQMQKSQEGSYALTPKGGSTEVTYTLSVQLIVPMIGLFRRKAEKMIMDTALKELKRRVENAG
ncbi:ribosome-associated toxin RatA of RatAB toxin-antitoxin module [Saccharothrix ecbatanensis]|jgi:ribosome-associated toxin RatA of RatAB toxin-antitoxin module|uniref:Ribosome-associated toxin RatA of RatAB toxin-antitoxin module n=1 Tax=Saccharothrix ecbatanensis TaxID=1105145 RepID=A0A7W9M5R8_9PSEU|nr:MULTISPECIES: SRPBCC family protein [Saccharothrix]MBB5808481.1 ribosome-associated toxin RatA of RatAB toxin-antitoxin module [Saccharothrix ecbatanensis]